MIMISERIIAIDDDARVIKSLKVALNDFEVMGFNNGIDALKYLSRPNDVYIVLVDVMMPGLDGLSVLDQIKKTKPDISVIVMTAFSTQDITVQALRNRADDFIEKPFDIKYLKGRIRDLLREKEAVRANGRDKDEQIQRIKRFIDRNFSESTLEHIADELCLSTKYISRMFNERSGSSFREYKLNVKMDKAKEMLTSSSYTINDISDRLGYLNPESFMRVFKRRVKLTPTEYRQKHVKRRK